MSAATVARNESTLTVVPPAHFTLPIVAGLQDALLREVTAGAAHLVFDMKDVTVLDSSGIGLIVAAYNSMIKAGGTISLNHVPAAIFNLLSTMRLATRLNATPLEPQETGHG
jgi:anti-anti-sigma factor